MPAATRAAHSMVAVGVGDSVAVAGELVAVGVGDAVTFGAHAVSRSATTRMRISVGAPGRWPSAWCDLLAHSEGTRSSAKA
ncbi:MAG: hypothetical protein E6J13_14865 [Chloroflexi bacterium]|nr:MAG: hypothetical protein E6J13_14865 [Chloroflexota bacterium]